MSTDSTASPRQPTRYFDLLPLELIRHIIEQLAPIEYDQHTYQDRKRTLYSTSLVSRFFRKLVQPLLFEVIEFDGKDGMEKLKGLGTEEAGVQLFAWTRILVATGAEDFASHGDDFRQFAKIAHSLEELRCDLRDFCLRSFSDTNLRKLHLHGANLEHLEDVVLPHLEELSLVTVDYPEGGLQSRQFPSLRHFASFDDSDFLTSDEIQTFESLGPQLTSMTFNLEVLTELPFISFMASTLSLMFDCQFSSSELYKLHKNDVSHLRIFYHDIFGPGEAMRKSDDSVLKQWKCWAHILNSLGPNPPLCILYLSSYLLPEDEVAKSEFVAVLLALLSSCRKQGIEVVFEDQPLSCVSESQFSREFIRMSEVHRSRIEAREKGGME